MYIYPSYVCDLLPGKKKPKKKKIMMMMLMDMDNMLCACVLKILSRCAHVL